MRRVLLILTILAALFALAGNAAAADRYAGITRPEAVEKAKDDIVALVLALGTPPKKAAELRRGLDKHQPRVTKSSCKKIKAWKIVWPDSDPVFVNRGGIDMNC